MNNFFLAATTKSGVLSRYLETWAEWLDCDAHFERPLPVDRPGIVLTADGPRLHAPGHQPQYWHPGMAHRRLRIDHDGLLRALDSKPGESVLDCTLGMGHDALILLNAGLWVRGLDRNAALLYYTLDGLRRRDENLSKGIQVQCVDFREYLSKADADSVDYVYLDPMFPRGYRRRSVTWSVMRAVTDDGGRLDGATLEQALRVASKRVILKLAPNEPPPRFRGLPEAYEDGSKRVRFAVWSPST